MTLTPEQKAERTSQARTLLDALNTGKVDLGPLRDKLLEKSRSSRPRRRGRPAPISDEIVREIRQLHASGKTINELADVYPVSRSHIINIVTGRARRNVKAEVEGSVEGSVHSFVTGTGEHATNVPMAVAEAVGEFTLVLLGLDDLTPSMLVDSDLATVREAQAKLFTVIAAHVHA